MVVVFDFEIDKSQIYKLVKIDNYSNPCIFMQERK